jgi:predicted kinase
MARDLLTRQQVIDVFTQAIQRADATLWERIKAEPDERARLIAMADAFEVMKDELHIQIQELSNGN